MLNQCFLARIRQLFDVFLQQLQQPQQPQPGQQMPMRPYMQSPQGQQMMAAGQQPGTVEKLR